MILPVLLHVPVQLAFEMKWVYRVGAHQDMRTHAPVISAVNGRPQYQRRRATLANTTSGRLLNQVLQSLAVTLRHSQ